MKSQSMHRWGRFLVLLTAVLALFLLSGCGASQAQAKSDNKNNQAESTVSAAAKWLFTFIPTDIFPPISSRRKMRRKKAGRDTEALENTSRACPWAVPASETTRVRCLRKTGVCIMNAILIMTAGQETRKGSCIPMTGWSFIRKTTMPRLNSCIDGGGLCVKLYLICEM